MQLVARQLTMFESPEERADAQRSGIAGQPMSGRAILRATGMRDSSGAQRQRVNREIDAMMKGLFSEAVRDYGEEDAVCLLFRVWAQNPSYEPQDWFLELLVEYRAELFSEFARPDSYVYPSTDIYEDEAGHD